VDVSDDRGTEEQVDDLLEEVVAKVEAVLDGLLRDPGEADAPLKVEKGLIFAVGDKGIKVVVFTPGGLGGAGRGCTWADADSDFQWRSGTRLGGMTEGFEGSEEDIGAVGEDFDGKAERVEGVFQGQMKIGKKRVLRPSKSGAVGESGVESL
jgi:hypothetical protein